MCDAIYIEPFGKIALVGLFSEVHTTQVPCVHPRMAIYVSVSGLRPGSTGKLEIVHGEMEHIPLFGAEGKFPSNAGPLDVLDMQFIVNNLLLQNWGKHFIRFWGNDNLIGMRPFYVIEIKKNEPDAKEQP
jgi:hypothetical protein